MFQVIKQLYFDLKLLHKIPVRKVNMNDANAFSEESKTYREFLERNISFDRDVFPTLKKYGVV